MLHHLPHAPLLDLRIASSSAWCASSNSQGCGGRPRAPHPPRRHNPLSTEAGAIHMTVNTTIVRGPKSTTPRDVTPLAVPNHAGVQVRAWAWIVSAVT